MKLILLLIKDFIGFRDGKTELVPGLEEQAWFVDEWGKQIFCGHNKGTFLISGLKSKLASDVKGGMCMEKIELKEQSFLLEGAYALLNLYTETASGEYCLLGPYVGSVT